MNKLLAGDVLEFEFTFRASKGRTWPCAHFLGNNFQWASYEISNNPVTVKMRLDSDVDNYVAVGFYSKGENETIIENGKIVADQSLELVSIRVDGILLDSWFWTDGVYTPNYFKGYLEQVPNAPKEIVSQLIWHFPGRFTLRNLPRGTKFWDWYQQERTKRLTKDLVDPTGQLKENLNPMDDEARALVQEIKKLINV